MKRTLAQIHTDYEEILLSKQHDDIKDYKLAELMSELERTYKVPALRNEEWENRNKAVIALYRKISISRTF